MVTISELQVKDIIAIEDGRKLGHITDLEIDPDRGKIVALVIGAGGKMMGLFGKDDELLIPWEHIVTIGQDVILVKVKNNRLLNPTVHQN